MEENMKFNNVTLESNGDCYYVKIPIEIPMSAGDIDDFINTATDPITKKPLKEGITIQSSIRLPLDEAVDIANVLLDNIKRARGCNE